MTYRKTKPTNQSFIFHDVLQIVCDEKNDSCLMKFCQCDKSVIDTLSELSELLGCRESDPGCFEISDNTTVLN